MKKSGTWSFILGLVILAAYSWFVHPPGLPRGYLDDFCNEASLNVMSHNLTATGLPSFRTDRFMAPTGMSVPYFSWSIERDWIGSYVFLWNKNFPFLFTYFVLSLFGSYLIVGFLLKKLKLGPSWLCWLIATFVVYFHPARHYKFWHHYEYLTQHWIYASIFLDVLIWQKFVRQREWDLNLEVWRGFCLAGVVGGAGYFFGPMYLEWLVTRVCMAWVFWQRRKLGVSTARTWVWTKSILPVLLSAVIFVIACFWFLPLLKEMKNVGVIGQEPSFAAHFLHILRPYWIDPLLALFGLPALPHYNNPETIVTLGWLYWIPVILGVRALRKKVNGPGVIVVLPFLVLLITAVLYATVGGEPWIFQKFVQGIMPPMKFFRVCSRWGQFMPEIAAAIVLLAWPELRAKAIELWEKRKGWVMVFIALSVVELTPMFHPVHVPFQLDASTVGLLERLKSAPGTTVLDLPFCVAGANGSCTELQCPQYPISTIGQCFGGWHDKKVYGLYQARLSDDQCLIYGGAPYESWFKAWKENRCFKGAEWDQFCEYLDHHPELSAVLVYPQIWKGGGTEACRKHFDQVLGKPIDESMFLIGDLSKSTVLRYAPRCVPRKIR